MNNYGNDGIVMSWSFNSSIYDVMYTEFKGHKKLYLLKYSFNNPLPPNPIAIVVAS